MDNLFLILFFISFIALIVGLVKPTLFSHFIKGEMTRKRIAKFFSIITIVSFIIFGVTTNTSKDNQAIQKPAINTEVVVENEKQNLVEENQISEKNEVTVTSVTTVDQSQINQTETQNPSSILSETVSQKNAVKKAKSYLNYSAFSRDGLVSQLEYEQFSHADAVYGVDNSGANWNEQAVQRAESYMEYSAFSRGSLIEQLKHDKFTQAQAEYGVSAVGL